MNSRIGVLCLCATFNPQGSKGMAGDEGERGQSGLQVLFLCLLKLEFFSLVYLFPFWSRRVSNEREKKMGRQRSISSLSLQAAGISSIPSYPFANNNPQ